MPQIFAVSVCFKHAASRLGVSCLITPAESYFCGCVFSCCLLIGPLLASSTTPSLPLLPSLLSLIEPVLPDDWSPFRGMLLCISCRGLVNLQPSIACESRSPPSGTNTLFALQISWYGTQACLCSGSSHYYLQAASASVCPPCPYLFTSCSRQRS